VEIAIKDTGIGIDFAMHKFVFDKFNQTGDVLLHSSGKTKFKGGGPGLGLAIARGIVEAHGGRIWVESPGYNEKTNPGSTFFVSLPAEKRLEAN
jgi:signal transduction histidine kinase